MTGKPGTRAFGKYPHIQPVDVVRTVGFVGHPLFAGRVLHTLLDQRLGLRMQCQREAKGPACALPRVIVRSGADAAAGEHHVGRGKGALERGGDAVGIVAHIVGIGKAQTARGQQFDDLGHVLVRTLARENFIAHDDEAEGRDHG